MTPLFHHQRAIVLGAGSKPVIRNQTVCLEAGVRLRDRGAYRKASGAAPRMSYLRNRPVLIMAIRRVVNEAHGV